MDIFYRLHDFIFDRWIANWLVRYGYKHTLTGQITITFRHVANKFRINYGYIYSHQYKIADLIDSDERTKSKTLISDDTFMMTFDLSQKQETQNA